MKITLLTAGTRGDLDPFLALGSGLLEAGHRVTLCAPSGFGPQARARGLRFVPMDDDRLPAQVLGEGQTQGIREKRLGLKAIRSLMDASWEASQGAGALVYHATVMAGPHIAERLGIPRFVVVQAPLLTPTSEFPHPQAPQLSLGGAYNRATYRWMFQLTERPVREMLQEWRREVLGLPPAPPRESPFAAADELPTYALYCSSPILVPRPGDWPDTARSTGSWLLRDHLHWDPPEDLWRFLEAGPPPVYVGFGSMIDGNAAAMTALVLEALARAGQRGILASGWGALAEPPSSDEVFPLRAAPHEWLFPRTAAVVHHGGAGTTAMGLEAGRPTVICPFMGDQSFWGQRIHGLGLGPAPIPRKRLTVRRLAKAIAAAVGDPGIRRRAAAVGEKLREENGVAEAVSIIHRGVEAAGLALQTEDDLPSFLSSGSWLSAAPPGLRGQERETAKHEEQRG